VKFIYLGKTPSRKEFSQIEEKPDPYRPKLRQKEWFKADKV